MSELFLGILLFTDVSQLVESTEEGTAAAAVNGYEHVLDPPYMIKDVSYWVNYELLSFILTAER